MVNGNISALLEIGSGFNPEFTGLKNVYFYGTVMGLSKETIDNRLDDILAFADIGEYINQPLKNYSSGMQARLAFAMAINIDPDILILDEVLAVGDEFFKRKCFNKIQQLFDGGKTVLFVSHDEQNIKQFCTRAILLHENSILYDGQPKEVFHTYRKTYYGDDSEIAMATVDVSRPRGSDRPATETKGNSDGNLEASAGEQGYSKEIQWEPKIVNEKDFRFFDIKIVDSNGRTVNLLHHKEAYCLQFKIEVGLDVATVLIGAQISTMNGVNISGLNGIKSPVGGIKQGERFLIKWRFKCMLLPSTYFISIYANVSKNERRGVVNDAYAFKVIREGRIMGGYVSLEQQIDIEKSD